MKQTALLIIDVQAGLIKQHPYQEAILIEQLQQLLSKARKASMEVIFIRHDDGVGSDLAKGSEAWEIDAQLQPKEHERIFDKCYNSAFKETGLREYLDAQGVQQLIIAGMQCEYCIDTTIRVAFEYGYQIIVPKNGTSTFDQPCLSGKELLAYYEETIWKDRFADILSITDIPFEAML